MNFPAGMFDLVYFHVKFLQIHLHHNLKGKHCRKMNVAHIEIDCWASAHVRS